MIRPIAIAMTAIMMLATMGWAIGAWPWSDYEGSQGAVPWLVSLLVQ